MYSDSVLQRISRLLNCTTTKAEEGLPTSDMTSHGWAAEVDCGFKKVIKQIILLSNFLSELQVSKCVVKFW